MHRRHYMRYKIYFSVFRVLCFPVCVCVCVCVCVSVAQSCPTLCDPMNCSPPVSSVHGILQARILEWVATPFFMGSSPTRDWTWVSCIAGRFFSIWATNLFISELLSLSQSPFRFPQQILISNGTSFHGTNFGSLWYIKRALSIFLLNFITE